MIAFALAGIVATTAAHGTETLRAIAFIPKNDPVMDMANAWVKEVNDKLGRDVRINFIGGPEIIGRFQQIEAVKNGVVDIVIVPANDYLDRIPASGSFVLSQLSPSEERKSGFYDFMVEEHSKRLNVRYLGRMQISPFYLWTKKEPKTLADLKGLKMRSGVLYDRFMIELGMVPVTINAPEVFTAIESGLVDGFGWPVTGPRKRGWTDQVKNVIDLPFLGASNVVALLNLNKWNALSPSTQAQLTQLTAEFEPKMVKYFNKSGEEEWRAIGNSVKRVKFSEAENKKYLDLVYQVEWNSLRQRAPDLVERLRKMTGN
jgi:TRAP-type C4-dicarboxylate transport system substrate-binding protein